MIPLLFAGCAAHVTFPPVPDDTGGRLRYFDEWASFDEQLQDDPHPLREVHRLRNGALVADPLDLRPFAAEGSELEAALDTYSTHEPRADFFVFSGTGAMVAGGTLVGVLVPIVENNDELVLGVAVVGGGMMLAGIVSILLGTGDLAIAQEARGKAWAAWDESLRSELFGDGP